MGKKFTIFLIVIALLGASGYGYYHYKKTSIINDVKNDIEESLKAANIVAREIKIPGNKVSISPLKLISGKPLDISAKDLLITMAAEGSEGKLTIEELSFKYPAFKDKPLELCKIKNARISFVTSEVIINGVIKSTIFSPCMKLDQKPHQMKGSYNDLTIMVKQKTNPATILANMKCKALYYSQEGYLDKAPAPSIKTEFATYVDSVKKWYNKTASAGNPLWKVSTELVGLTFFAKEAGEEVSFSVDKSSFKMGINVSTDKSLSVNLGYDLNNLKVNNRKLAISWQLMGIQPTSIFPLTVKTTLEVGNVPAELLGASLFFMHNMGNDRLNEQYVSQVISAVFATLLKGTYPFDFNMKAHMAGGVSGNVAMIGKAGVGGVNANGTITLKSMDTIVNNLSQVARSSFERSIADKLTCDSNYKKCTGQFILRNGKIDFIQKW